eukprot:1800399-Prymnesium_polylepis.1
MRGAAKAAGCRTARAPLLLSPLMLSPIGAHTAHLDHTPARPTVGTRTPHVAPLLGLHSARPRRAPPVLLGPSTT